MSVIAKQSVRNHIFHEITRSVCPECRNVIDAQVLLRDNAVYLRKYCRQHGWHEALVSSDIKWYLDSQKYNKPGAIPNDFATNIRDGCPHDCGLCPEHQQHTCIGVLEITTRCNLECPTCFANAGAGYDLSLTKVEAILDQLLHTEGSPEVLQISGGEPTLHPQILDIIAAAQARDIWHVMLNTNGMRLAQEPDFVRQMAAYRPAVYLQFDGISTSTYQTLRGRDLFAIKQRALEHLAEFNIPVVLVATITKGVNDSEIGAILNYGLNHPAVLGVSFQPATFVGRFHLHTEPLHRITTVDVLHALERQTAGLFRVSDFRPVPCPHPTCSACTYAFVDGQQVTPIPRLLSIDDYLDFITNRALVDLSADLRPALEALWSMAAVMGSNSTTSNLSCVTCGINLPLNSNLQSFREHFFMVQVHGFMDQHTLDLKRLMKCCVHQLLPDGRAVPFCAYNTLGYREQVRQELEASDDR